MKGVLLHMHIGLSKHSETPVPQRIDSCLISYKFFKLEFNFSCVCACVLMCASMCACVSASVCVSVCACVRACIRVCVCVRAFGLVYLCVQACVRQGRFYH